MNHSKVIWAALAIPSDKEVVLIEPVKVLVRNKRGDIETIVVPAHVTTPINFLEKATELADVATELK